MQTEETESCLIFSIKKIASLFPLWAILFSVVSLTFSDFFSNLKFLIIPLLIVIMFTMGITLTIRDFLRVLKNPSVIILGVALQYLVMPLSAFAISKILGLQNELLIGMVLVGSVAGGTASNVICYLAKGDVALSVTMTTFSTFIAFILTPVLTSFYAGEYIPVPIVDMVLSILEIVLLPLLVGVWANKYLSKIAVKSKDIFPLISMIAIVVIIAIVVALNKERLLTIGGTLIIAVISHNLIGLALGFYVCKLLGYSTKICKTVAIEVGMQNSGLAVALASKYFPTLATLPSAVFSVWHNLSGSILAGYWTRKSNSSFVI